MWQALSQIILRNRITILTIILLITGGFAYFALTKLKLDNKYGNMLPKDSPAQSNYLKFKSMFGEDGGTLVFAIQSDKLYSETHFVKWKELGDRLLDVDGVESVVSEANIVQLNNDIENKIFVPEVVFLDTSFTERSIEEIERIIRSNPLYNNVLFNDSANVSLMLISVDEAFLSDQKKANVVLDIEKIAEEYESYFGQIHFAGLPHIRVVIGKRVINEMYIFIALAIFVTSLLLYIFFRSLRVVLICNLVVVIAVIWSLGTIGIFGFHLSILMALIPPLMIVIGIPNCIFLLTKFHREVANHGNKIKALKRIIVKIGNATFMTNLTTALGFSTFIFTNSEKLIEFGIVASLNIIMVFILSITIIPIVFSFTKNPKERHLKHLENRHTVSLVDKFEYIVINRRKTVYITTLVVIVLSAIGLSQIKATGNLTGDLPEGDPILKDVQFIQKHFQGAIPFEVMVDYKESGRLFSRNTLVKVEELQNFFNADTMISKSLSIVDFVKFINMSYYGNNPDQYQLIANKDKRFIKPYFDNFSNSSEDMGGFTLKELVDTTNTTLRIRMQMMDIGSYEIAQKVDDISPILDSILNPDKKRLEGFYRAYSKGKKNYADSILFSYNSVFSKTTTLLAGENDSLQLAFDMYPETIQAYYEKAEFSSILRQAIDNQYLDFTITGTSVVAAEGTQYLVKNLLTSLLFAIIIIAILMAILFRSWRMVIVSLIPNFIPLLVTAGIMGYFHIPIKPSTILVFSIAFGISVDDTIHFLAKYRQELKHRSWDINGCVLNAFRETGLSMFYTSIVLFFGFNMFSLSQFGGTQALGLLVSLTLLIAMITNLILLPSLLLSLQRKLSTKSFIEPYFELLDEEEDIELDDLHVRLENTNKTTD
jgi:uncharacterized protein